MSSQKQQIRFSATEDEQLIEIVSGYPILWDMKLKEFKNVAKKDTIWNEMDKMLNKPDGQCKSRWKSVRDHYKRQRRLEKNTPTGSAGTKKRAVYWDRLRFLDGVEDERESQSNIQSAEIDITDEDQGEPHNSNHCTAGDEQDRTGTDDTAEEQLNENKFKRKRETSRSRKSDKDKPEVLSLVSPSTKRNRPNETLLQLLKNKEQERQQLGKYVDQLMESSEENEIDLLFKSLAATVKKFQAEDVIEAKMKIFNVVTEIELRNQRARKSRMSTYECCTRPSSALSSHSSSHTYVEQSSVSNMSMASLPPNINFSENAPYAIANPLSPLQVENAHPPSMMSAQFNTDLSEAPFVNPALPLQVQNAHSSSKVLPWSNILSGDISSEDPSSSF